MAQAVKIDNVFMPLHFSYNLATPQKRQSIVQTIDGVKWLYSAYDFDGDSQFSWSCDNCNVCEVSSILGAMTFGAEISFNGYWGEVLTVVLMTLDSPEPAGGGLYDLSGMFNVILATTWFSGVSSPCSVPHGNYYSSVPC